MAATKRKPSSRKATGPKKDAYELVTNQIIAALEADIVPWARPWRSGGGQTSLATGKPYKGINVFILEATAALKGYSSRYWVTFNQAKERGRVTEDNGRPVLDEEQNPVTNDAGEPLYYGGVRAGERATAIVFWKPIEKKDPVTGEVVEKFPILRYFQVFNLDQCDGVAEPPSEPVVEFDPIERAEAIQAGMPQRPRLKHGGDRAYYSPRLDYVQMPTRTQFSDGTRYYATLFHELVHSTGHESRIGRKEIGNPSAFGDPDYSREELVAEMGAAFLCGDAGIDPVIPQHAAYIASWLKALKDDKKLVVHAAAAAQKAARFILGAAGEEDSPAGENGSTTGVEAG